MDQIRFDFLTNQAAVALSRSAGTAATTSDSTDAFSQVLDQELADAKERSSAPQSNPEATQGNGDANGYGGKSSQAWRTTNRRRDGAQNQSTVNAKPRQSSSTQITAKATVQTKSPSTASAKSTTNNQTAAADRTSSDTNAPSTTAKADGSADTTVTASDGKPDPSRDAGKDAQPQTTDADNGAAPQSDLANAAATVTSTATVVVPALLPLQIVTTTKSADLLSGKGGGGAALPLLQGSLLAQQEVDLNALTASAQTGTNTGKSSLSFGAVIAADAQASLPGGIAAAAAAPKDTDAEASTADPTDDSDPFDRQAPDGQNPAAQIAAAQNPRGVAAGSRSATGAKAKDGDVTPTSPVTAATANQVRSPSVVQPVSPSFAPAWSGSGGSNDPYGDSAAGYGSSASADADFSTLSQYLGANAAEGLASGMNTRQSAFIAQLKQNLQILPPNEQIAVQIQNAMQKGSTRVTVDLEPAELGRVEVKLNVDKDKNVTAQVVVDRPATLDLLQRDSQTLERALQDAGLQTSSGSLSFNLRDTGGQGGGAQQNGGGGQAGAGVGSGTVAADTAGKGATADIVATADGYVDLKT